MDFDSSMRAYLTRPSDESREELRASIMGEASYDPYALFGEHAATLLEEGRARAALNALESAMPGLFLSPSAHALLARAHRALGDPVSAERELNLSQIALRTILDSGSGSQASPWRVWRLADEYDVLALTERSSASQMSVQVGESFLDVHTCHDESTACFLLEGAQRFALRG